MIIPSRIEFDKELKKIEDQEIKNNLEKLFNHVNKTEIIEDADIVAENMLTKLFTSSFSNEILIPLSFHKSALGMIIFNAYYNSQTYYSMNDLIEMTKTEERPKGYTRQYLNQEIHAQNLEATRSGGRWLFTKMQINNYLIPKGYKGI